MLKSKGLLCEIGHNFMGVIAFPTKWADPGVDTLMDKNNHPGCLRVIPEIQVMEPGRFDKDPPGSRERCDDFSRHHSL